MTVSDAGLCIVLGFTVLASLATQTIKNLPVVWETGFDPWVGKIPWRREWLPTPVFLLGEFHGQKLQFKGSQSQARRVTITFTVLGDLVHADPRGEQKTQTSRSYQRHGLPCISRAAI